MVGPDAKMLIGDKKKKKVIGRVQTRKWIKLALSECHLSAWHYAPQTVGRKRARYQNQIVVLVVRVGGFV